MYCPKLKLDRMLTDPLNDFATLEWWKSSCIMYLSHSPLEAKDFQFKAQDEFSADRQASPFPFIATSYSGCRLWIGLHFMDFIETVWNNFLQMSPGCFELVGLKKNIMHFSISTCDTDAVKGMSSHLPLSRLIFVNLVFHWIHKKDPSILRFFHKWHW